MPSAGKESAWPTREPETVLCGTCDQPTLMDGTKRCDWCYEVESRLEGYLRRGGAKAFNFVVDTLQPQIDSIIADLRTEADKWNEKLSTSGTSDELKRHYRKMHEELRR